jgi:hypothetical protein
LERIARVLLQLATLRILDTQTHMAMVNKRRGHRKRKIGAAVTMASLKCVNRRQKRKICNLIKQNTDLRTKVAKLNQEVKSLKSTIKELLAGRHDMELKGKSQSDAEIIMNECVQHPSLESHIKENDPTGTLHAFWHEQLLRMDDPDRRSKWNPIVLRFMLDLWENMGERNFRLLEKEGILRLPSKSTLIRQRRKISKGSESDPATYNLCRKVVGARVVCVCVCVCVLFAHTVCV